MNIQQSIKTRLKNRAIKENRTFQEILTIYGLERMLYRLSTSKYKNHYVLKGGVLLYAMYDGKYTRGTADVDLLGYLLSNDLETVKRTFIEIFSISFEEDGISFDIASLRATRIAKFKKYPGINISIDGYLSKTKLFVQIDIGFGDVVYPKFQTIDYPTLLNLPVPTILAYSKESIIAEKFHAIVTIGYANTRMKDFYDIYVLLNTYDFEGHTLREAINDTFENRRSSYNNISAFENEFALDPYRKRIWISFMKAKKIEMNVELNEVIDSIKKFINPVLCNDTNQIPSQWNPKLLVWI